MLFQECSHYCEFVSVPNQMPRALEVAIREAVGKRGVSVLRPPRPRCALRVAHKPRTGCDGQAGDAWLGSPRVSRRPRRAL